MRLGMMQPYLFPYVGYFGLIHRSDVWIVFDTAQYIRRGWVNRNRVLTTGDAAWKYVRVPIARADVSAQIRDVRIDARQQWKRDFFNGLDAYRNQRAPYYAETMDFLEATLSVRCDRLSELLTHCLVACCRRLGLPFEPKLFSQMKLALPSINGPGDWAMETSRVLGVQEYVNPPGGETLFDRNRFQRSGISLKILKHRLPEYRQGEGEFVPGLSIIDVMMWNSPAESLRIVEDYELISDYESQAA